MRVIIENEDRYLRRRRYAAAGLQQDRDAPADERVRKMGKSLGPAFRLAALDQRVAADHEVTLRQALDEPFRRGGFDTGTDLQLRKPMTGHCSLLRADRTRRSDHCTAEHRDDMAPPDYVGWSTSVRFLFHRPSRRPPILAR